MAAKIVWIIGAVVIVVSGSLLLYRAAHAPDRLRVRATVAPETPGSVPASDSGELERLRADLRLLEGQISGLRDDVARQPPATPSAPIEQAAPAAPEDPVALRAQREEGDRQWKEHMVEVASEFERENYDRNFAARAQAAVGESLRDNPVVQAVAGNIDCRSRTCRIEIKDGREDSVAKQLPLFLMSLHGSLPNMQADTFEKDGKLTYLLYLTNAEPTAMLQPGGG